MPDDELNDAHRGGVRTPKCRNGRSYNSERQAAAALEEVRARRLRNGAPVVETRYYEHRVSQGGCGKFHLTSKDYADDES